MGHVPFPDPSKISSCECVAPGLQDKKGNVTGVGFEPTLLAELQYQIYSGKRLFS